MTKKIPAEFIVNIQIRNDAGQVVGTKEFITYQGLLAMAHAQGLAEIETTLLQAPADDNGQVAIVRATARANSGTYTGLGDASPENVNRKVARHLLRVAETRAKARALRDLTNVAMVSLEELCGDDEVAEGPPVTQTQHRAAPVPGGRGLAPASDAQRRALWRKAQRLGYERSAVKALLAHRLGADPSRMSKQHASRLLDELERQVRARLRSDRAAE